jgi:antitoxin component of RelBE/YafQ-DinJ toxin-antitoxin module
MENRTARLTLLIDPTKKQVFDEVCSSRDLTPSQVVRQMIRDYVQQHGSAEQIARMPPNN